MTEEQWLKCQTPDPLVEFVLLGSISERKLLFFASASLRRYWGHYSQVCRDAVEVVERFADGLADAAEVATVRLRLRQENPNLFWPEDPAGHFMLAAFFITLHREAADEEFFTEHPIEGGGDSLAMAMLVVAIQVAIAAGRGKAEGEEQKIAAERAVQADILRDLVANPFRPLTIPASLLTDEVLALAREAYEHRDLPSGTLSPARLGVLADALAPASEASVDVAGLLEHLRGRERHWRGCVAVDAILGRH